MAIDMPLYGATLSHGTRLKRAFEVAIPAASAAHAGYHVAQLVDEGRDLHSPPEIFEKSVMHLRALKAKMLERIFKEAGRKSLQGQERSLVA